MKKLCKKLTVVATTTFLVGGFMLAAGSGLAFADDVNEEDKYYADIEKAYEGMGIDAAYKPEAPKAEDEDAKREAEHLDKAEYIYNRLNETKEDIDRENAYLDAAEAEYNRLLNEKKVDADVQTEDKVDAATQTEDKVDAATQTEDKVDAATQTEDTKADVKAEAKATGNSPKTGDTASVAGFSAVALISAVGVFLRKKIFNS